MKHFIYPKADSFITNDKTYISKNFGADNLLSISAKINSTSSLAWTSSLVSISENGVTICDVKNLTGFVRGDMSGIAQFITGSVIDC